jgi:AmiR/NasT family two-component response regulator
MAMSLRVLLADDESLNALALRAQLEALGHIVVGSARNGL